jgi:hypothetical protein
MGLKASQGEITMTTKDGLVKRWRGGAARSRGFTQIGARIELAKRRKSEPQYDWEAVICPDETGRFELHAYERRS